MKDQNYYVIIEYSTIKVGNGFLINIPLSSSLEISGLLLMC